MILTTGGAGVAVVLIVDNDSQNCAIRAFNYRCDNHKWESTDAASASPFSYPQDSNPAI